MPFVKDGSLFGRWDLDDIFHYGTNRRVVFRDRRLCFCKILICVGALLYGLVVAVWLEEGYLVKERPSGVVNLSLRDQTDVNITALPYCGQESNGTFYQEILPCRDLEYLDAMELYSNGIGLTTRVTPRTIQFPAAVAKECFMNSKECARKYNLTYAVEPTFYTAGAEVFSLMIAHSAYGMSINKDVSFADMEKGKLVRRDGSSFINFISNEYLTMYNGIRASVSNRKPIMDVKERIGDALLVEQWLQSAGHGFNSDSPKPASDNKLKETLRYSGGVVLIIIEYASDTKRMTHMTYTYKTILLPDIEFKSERVFWQTNPDGTLVKTIWNTHGMRFITMQSGFLSEFNFTELLKSWFSAFALFSIASFIVDKILIQLLPMSRLYKSYMNAITVDFSEVQMDDHTGTYTVMTKGGEPSYHMSPADVVFGTLLRGGLNNTPPSHPGNGFLDHPLHYYAHNSCTTVPADHYRRMESLPA